MPLAVSHRPLTHGRRREACAVPERASYPVPVKLGSLALRLGRERARTRVRARARAGWSPQAQSRRWARSRRQPSDRMPGAVRSMAPSRRTYPTPAPPARPACRPRDLPSGLARLATRGQSAPAASLSGRPARCWRRPVLSSSCVADLCLPRGSLWRRVEAQRRVVCAQVQVRRPAHAPLPARGCLADARPASAPRGRPQPASLAPDRLQPLRRGQSRSAH